MTISLGERTLALRKPRLIKPRREQIPAGACLCDYCTAKCCRYFALPIDTPEERGDFDYLRWYLLHGETTLFVDDGVWYLMVHTACKKLQSDGRCGVYEDDWTYEKYFETAEQLDEFVDARFSLASSNAIRSPRPVAFPILN
jgi:hypothetical protein